MTTEDRLSYCSSNYPIILVSGLGFHDQHRLLNYWGNIPEFLKMHGADVYTANQEAFISLPDNAIKLKFRILDILDKTKKERINIIAHSKGGLEARYLAGKLGMDEHIASITTLGTPHKGAYLADIILGRLPLPKFAAARLVNLYATLLGDKRPDSLRSLVQVSTQSVQQFNEEVIDSSVVYYQSYAGHVNKHYPNIIWRTMANIIKDYEGSNDGMVGIESSKWGNYRGVIQNENALSVSHGDMVGLTHFLGNTKFDAKQFFLDMVHELKEKGY